MCGMSWLSTVGEPAGVGVRPRPLVNTGQHEVPSLLGPQPPQQPCEVGIALLQPLVT